MEPSTAVKSIPSTQLQTALRRELQAHLPFSEMAAADVDFFIANSQEVYFSPQEVIAEPAHGVIQTLYFIRRGATSASRGLAELSGGALHYEAGDLFPISGAVASRPASAVYRAVGDTFCLALPVAAMQQLTQRSHVFADFLSQRVLKFLALSRRAVQAAYASRTLAEQSMEQLLGELPRKRLLTALATDTIASALQLMVSRKIGSMLIVDDKAQGKPIGILTRDDVLERIALPQRPLTDALHTVMSSPVYQLPLTATAQDAVLMMSDKHIRHVAVVDEHGAAVNMVSERDLFAMQRLSLRHISQVIHQAPDLATLKIAAADIRTFAQNLLAQGVQARQLTALISHLNDVLTSRLLALLGQAAGLDWQRACWIALGSEGRGEQTIATDQDNALVLDDAVDAAERNRWLAMALQANQALDSMGYPLCKGSIMASNETLCQPQREWLERFSRWMSQGTPEDLLGANIFFDLRALYGNAELVTPLQQRITQQVGDASRFMHLLTENALKNSPPLTWLGGLDTQDVGGSEGLDIKFQGTAMVVDAARIFALKAGIRAQNTRERLLHSAPLLNIGEQEAQSWVFAFEFLQMQRLNLQMNTHSNTLAAASPSYNPNWLPTDTLNDIDRKILKESFRQIQRLQQRLGLELNR